VHTEKELTTLLELVNKYPSKVFSKRKNTSGDDIVDIVIDDHIGEHGQLKPWSLNVSINTSKSYNVDRYRLSAATKIEPFVEVVEEIVVKKYLEIKPGVWIPSDWESVQHNGNPSNGSRVNFVINDCRINETAQSRLNDFRFSTNLPVLERTQASQPEKIHIWGAENKPSRSFDDHIAFLDYYSEECPLGVNISPRSDYFALHIGLIILGLIMIAVAMYRLYAKER